MMRQEIDVNGPNREEIKKEPEHIRMSFRFERDTRAKPRQFFDFNSDSTVVVSMSVLTCN